MAVDGAPPIDSIVLEEEIDPNYIPSQKEVEEYATCESPTGQRAAASNSSRNSRKRQCTAPCLLGQCRLRLCHLHLAHGTHLLAVSSRAAVAATAAAPPACRAHRVGHGP